MARVLIYSHDSFGLGHIRRCLTIAGALTAAFADTGVVILSGSPLIGRFDLPERVDYVSVPGVVKRVNGDYVSRDSAEPLAETIRLRAEIIRQVAESFDPDLFLVDKEPLGLKGEVAETLHFLKARGTRIVLGLRDILDDPKLLAVEWRRKSAVAALEVLYDEIWVFGLREIWDPLTGIPVSFQTKAKTHFTGYLDRRRTGRPSQAGEHRLLVTPGGGGDGTTLVDWVLSAYEQADDLPPATILLGPFMPAAAQAAFRARADRLDQLDTEAFSAQTEDLFARAAGVVAMGGYNTFAEILSYDLPALLVPREAPRKEQRLRADRAAALGLGRVLHDDGTRSPQAMIGAIRALADQPRPSRAAIPSLLDGLGMTSRLAAPWLQPTSAQARSSA
jgi:predicted glycosyltransferase